MVRHNYSTEERKALVELVSYTKSIGFMMQQSDTLVADALWETVHAEVQDLFTTHWPPWYVRPSGRRKKFQGFFLICEPCQLIGWQIEANLILKHDRKEVKKVN